MKKKNAVIATIALGMTISGAYVLIPPVNQAVNEAIADVLNIEQLTTPTIKEYDQIAGKLYWTESNYRYHITGYEVTVKNLTNKEKHSYENTISFCFKLGHSNAKGNQSW